VLFIIVIIIMPSYYFKCHNAPNIIMNCVRLHAKYRYAECCHTECCYTRCHYALSVFLMSAIMPSAVILSAIMPSDVLLYAGSQHHNDKT
jgi:hypothetical protein